MTKGTTGGKPDARSIYGDIIDLPHHQSAVKPHISLHDRAAQFAPFAALTGYDDMVAEEARLTDRELLLSESEADALDRTLLRIEDLLEEGIRPEASIDYFIPDPLKEGGRYETVTDTIYRIDPVEQKVLLTKTAGRAKLHQSIDIGRILEIRIAGDPSV